MKSGEYRTGCKVPLILTMPAVCTPVRAVFPELRRRKGDLLPGDVRKFVRILVADILHPLQSIENAREHFSWTGTVV